MRPGTIIAAILILLCCLSVCSIIDALNGGDPLAPIFNLIPWWPS